MAAGREADEKICPNKSCILPRIACRAMMGFVTSIVQVRARSVAAVVWPMQGCCDWQGHPDAVFSFVVFFSKTKPEKPFKKTKPSPGCRRL
jgi:hypothetical protein